MGVEAADFSRWVLRSTEAELSNLLEVPKKSGDSCCTIGIGQGSPGCCGRISDEISDIYIATELYGSVGHGIR